MVDRLLVYDGAAGTFRTVKRVRDPGCPLCGDKPTILDAGSGGRDAPPMPLENESGGHE